MNNERDEKGGEFEENWWTGKQCKKPLLHFSFTLTRGALSARSSGRFEPDSGATADHNDGLPEELRFAQDGRGGGCGAHDSYDQQSKIAFALRRDVQYFCEETGSQIRPFSTTQAASDVTSSGIRARFWFSVLR